MALPPRSSLVAWPDEIARVAATQMNVTLTFLGSDKTLVCTTPGRFQHLRSPLDASSAAQWSTKRAGRAQIPLDATTGMIRKGLLCQISAGVDDKGNAIPLRDPTLGLVTFTVQSAINSSHAALRTVEMVSELAPTPRA